MTAHGFHFTNEHEVKRDLHPDRGRSRLFPPKITEPIDRFAKKAAAFPPQVMKTGGGERPGRDLGSRVFRVPLTLLDDFTPYYNVV